MKAHTLQGKKRDLTGRKVKQLRREGVVPATVYGKKLTSTSVAVTTADFQKVYDAAGETGLVELHIGDSVHPVLIHNVQIDPVNESVLHVEFYQVDLKEKVKTKVPLVVVGESPAVSERRGVVLTLLTEVEVEALPTDLPEKIEVDVAKLTDVDQEVKVSELKIPTGVTVITDSGLGVVKIGALVSKEAEAQAAADAAASAEAAALAEAPPEDGKAVPATEAKVDEKSAEKPTEESKPQQK